MRFKDKVCIVTGGGSGIGLAACTQFASEGGKVAIVDYSKENGNKAVAEVPGSMFVQCDVGSVEQLEGAVARILAAWGKIDIVVNDAAVMTFDSVVDLKPEDWDHVLAVNLRAVFILSKLCIPHMNGGAIVNISSVHAHETTANVAAYASSKGAMEAFSRAVSQEHPAEKVRINCVAPGAIDTPMLWNNPNVKSGKEQLSGPIGKPEDVAAAICFLACDDARFINGTTLVVDGGRLDKL